MKDENVVMIINPGAGPVDGTSAREARRNIGALCRDLALPLPRVRVERRPGADHDGRYGYVLRRGIRETEVTMPGLSLDRVRLGPGDNPWHFPRLYVDGSSWLWPYAVEMARHALLDHDGSSKRAHDQSEAACDEEFTRLPRCLTCGTVKERYWSDDENPPEGLTRLRCLTCVPIDKTSIKSWDLESTYVDDSWKRLPGGCVYRVTERRMPDEATGTRDDPACPYRSMPNQQCRLKRGHAGPCARHWQEIKRERIALPYREEP